MLQWEKGVTKQKIPSLIENLLYHGQKVLKSPRKTPPVLQTQCQRVPGTLQCLLKTPYIWQAFHHSHAAPQLSVIQHMQTHVFGTKPACDDSPVGQAPVLPYPWVPDVGCRPSGCGSLAGTHSTSPPNGTQLLPQAMQTILQDTARPAHLIRHYLTIFKHILILSASFTLTTVFGLIARASMAQLHTKYSLKVLQQECDHTAIRATPAQCISAFQQFLQTLRREWGIFCAA